MSVRTQRYGPNLKPKKGLIIILGHLAIRKAIPAPGLDLGNGFTLTYTGRAGRIALSDLKAPRLEASYAG